MRRNSLKLALAAAAIGLGACQMLQTPAAPDPDLLSTAVSGTLTAVPARTLPPEATDTLAPAAPTEALEEATATPLEATDAPGPGPTTTASPTPIPTNTPAGSPTSEPAGTLPPGDIRATLGDPTWRDTLSSGNNWSLGEDTFTRATVGDGELHLTGLTTTDGWRLTGPVVRDFYLEMTVRTGNCSGDDRYGLIARVPDRRAADRGYLFGFTCGGRYSLRAWDGPSETMTSLIGWTGTTAVVSGSERVNRIGLWADGEQLALYANGTLIGRLEDGTFANEGNFGIFVGARQTENFTIHVDEIAYWADP